MDRACTRSPVATAALFDERGDAYAHLARHHDDEWSVELVARPGAAVDLDALLADAVGVIAAEGGGHVTYWVHGTEADPAADARATGAGFVAERDLLQMRVPLPLADPARWPEGTTVRTFRVGEDEAAWVPVNNRAFAGHPEQGAWTVDMLRAREQEDWFDPEGFVLAFDADGLAGFCWTKVHPPQPPREPDALGEIYVIGADPSRHGRGLGRALTTAGLESLASARHHGRPALRRRRQRSRGRALPRPRLRHPPHRPRLRARRRVRVVTTDDETTPLRRGPRRRRRPARRLG